MAVHLNDSEKKPLKEGRFKKACNWLMFAFMICLSKCPFWIIYGISDLLYFLNKYLFKYRFNVSTSNLKHAFPEKSETEIKAIRDKFYRHLTDLILESIKMHGMSAKQMDKHIQFEGLDIVESYEKSGQSLIILAFHHNNWEWCSFSQTKLKHQVLMVYNPLRRNARMEKFILKSREKWGGESVLVNKTARTALNYQKENKLSILWLAADQTPLANSKFWTVFLNRETPFFSGPEKIAHRTNQPVLIQHVRKVKRGKYIANYSVLAENPAELEEKEILLRYIRKMEEIIRKEPEYYLWSHRRWKHNRPEGIELIS